MIVVSCGLGTNSVALLLGLKDRDIKPDLILFADPGGEMPHTYKYLGIMQDWLAAVGFPPITVVKKVDKNGDVLTLEENCLQKKMLPSVAYGFKTCSQKFKIQPQDKYMNNYGPAKLVWARGEKITKFIGYDAGEPQRAEKDHSCKKYDIQYPLLEWDWGREECELVIDAWGLPQPGKSNCYFCPNSKTIEIRALKANHPELMDRALKMESGADLSTIKGLGRGHYSWKNVVATDEMFDFPSQDMPCGCYDGGGF